MMMGIEVVRIYGVGVYCIVVGRVMGGKVGFEDGDGFS